MTCSFGNAIVECDGNGFLVDVGDPFIRDDETPRACPACRSADFLLDRKEEAENTLSWSDGISAGTGDSLWLSAVRTVLRFNSENGAKALRSVGTVEALITDDSAPDGYRVTIREHGTPEGLLAVLDDAFDELSGHERIAIVRNAFE
jgi:hypothetical protein